MKLGFLGLALLLACVAPACGGGDDDKPGSNTAVGAGQTTSVEITAAEGGEVTVGEASLDIPGGALPGDTTVTVETAAPSSSLPDSGSLKGLVYDFGPDGTEFTAAATLTLPSVGAPGEGKVAVIAWLDEEANAWQDLATTTASDGSLSAEITHFTKFVVRLNDVETTDCSFSKCGGDLVGTWTVTGLCAEFPESEDPFMGMCPEGTVEADVSVTGSITFDSDGTFSKSFTTSNVVTFTVPASCLVALNGGMAPAACSELAGEDTTCSGDPSEACTCVEQQAPSTDASPGTWEATAGGDLTMTDDGGEAETSAFCEQDGTVKVHRVTQDNVTVTWTAERQ